MISPIRFFREFLIRTKKFISCTFFIHHHNESQILENLRKNGYHIFNEKLDNTNKIENFSKGRMKGKLDINSNYYWNNLIGKEYWFHSREIIDYLKTNSQLFKYADEYLNAKSLVSSVDIYESFYTMDSEFGSRSWHKDADDFRTLKLFIYITDVESDKDGPLETIPLKNEFKLLKLFPFNLKRLKENGIFLRILNLFNCMNKRKTFFGKAGTCFLVDTARLYHRGSRCFKNHSRTACIFTFISTKPLFNTNVDPWLSKWSDIKENNKLIRQYHSFSNLRK